MAKKATRAAKAAPAQRLYTLEVRLIGGPVSEAFVEKNPEVARTIQIRGDQTLEDLHEALFDAFGREEEHMYEFQVGKKPHDKNAQRYVLPEMDDGFEMSFFDDDGSEAGAVDETTLDALELKARSKFYYWFDFGDDWWHEIKVTAIGEVPPKEKFPKVIARVGEDPPQYRDYDEEEDE